MSLALQYPKHMDVQVRPPLIVEDASDEALMLAYAEQADQSAFAELYTRYKKSVYRYCVRMLKDEGLGADVYQEVWSKLIKGRERYQVKAKFKTYIFHIAHNLIIDHWRKQSSQGQKLQWVSTDVDPDEGASVELESSADIFRDLVDAEQLQLFKQALHALPPDQRDAVLLHYEQGFTLEQIAEMNAVGRETIKSRLRYAVKKLKHQLSTNEVNT